MPLTSLLCFHALGAPSARSALTALVAGVLALTPCRADDCQENFLFADRRFATGEQATISVGDLNNDGITDMVVSAANHQLGVYLGQGAGLFGPRANYPTATGTAQGLGRTLLVDMNRDGFLDVVALYTTSRHVTVFRNLGTGAFAGGVSYTSLPVPIAVDSADFNADGNADIVVANQSSGSITVRFGTPTGVLTGGATHAVGTQCWAVATGDIDNDGDPDIVARTGFTANAVLLFNNAGVFTVGSSLPLEDSGQGHLLLRDFDADGDLDIAVDDYDDKNDEEVITVMPNSGGAGFGPRFSYPISTDPSDLRAGDLDLDGDLDILTTSILGTVEVLANNGDATLAPRATYRIGQSQYHVALGDLNGDGALDLAHASLFNVSVTLNHGNGTFPSLTQINSFSGAIRSALADIDGDGDLDLSCTGATWRNDGAGNFSARAILPFTSTVGEFAFADLDGDLDEDLVGVVGGGINILLNNGLGVFTRVSTFGSGWSVLGTSDFDADGDVDIVVADNANDLLHLMFNNGAASFTAPVTYPSGRAPVDIAIGDIDNDLDLDVLTLNMGSNNMSLYRNNGAGVFAAPTTLGGVGVTPLSFALADLDGDGDLDIAANNGNSRLQTVRNTGGGAFTGWRITVLTNDTTAVSAADVDLDGDMDILTGSLTLLRNAGDGSFPTGPEYHSQGGARAALGDIDADGDTDAAVPLDNIVNIVRNIGVYSPRITLHPIPTSVPRGAAVEFTVEATGTGPLSYQWRKDAKDIPGATAPTLELPAAALTDAGAYTVAVIGCETAVSNPAALTVTCRADWNADTTVNSTDVSDFINAWFTDQAKGSLATDIDGNGVVNSTDVSEFINLWFDDAAAGC